MLLVTTKSAFASETTYDIFLNQSGITYTGPIGKSLTESIDITNMSYSIGNEDAHLTIYNSTGVIIYNETLNKGDKNIPFILKDAKSFSIASNSYSFKSNVIYLRVTGTPVVVATPTPTVQPTATTTPEPSVTASPVPTPIATPDTPSGEQALLKITLTTGQEKEFDLPMSEVNAFINWYDASTGTERYGINKHENNKGPFNKRTEYVIHDKILTFEVSEYTTK